MDSKELYSPLAVPYSNRLIQDSSLIGAPILSEGAFPRLLGLPPFLLATVELDYMVGHGRV